MKFSDIQFKPRNFNEWKATVSFSDKFELSIIAGKSAYCSPKTDLSSPFDYHSYEIAIFNSDGDFCTKEFFNDALDDVIGWQTVEDIELLMKRITEITQTV